MTRDPRAVLREAGLRPKKAFGQNFLIADGLARTIAATAVPDAEIGAARVVEIGAGTGALTEPLAERARWVIAIERDRDLVPLLDRHFAGTAVRVVAADAQTLDLRTLLGDDNPMSPRVVCGNLPYAITGSLLRLVCAQADAFERAVLMVQNEVAARLLARPGTKEWGALSVFMRARFGIRRVLIAMPGAFHPPPEVRSAVVELARLNPPRAIETERFQALVRGAFEARRKTLRNAWTRLAAASKLEEAASLSGIDLDVRGETLDVEAFGRMATALDEGSTELEDRTG